MISAVTQKVSSMPCPAASCVTGVLKSLGRELFAHRREPSSLCPAHRL
jgi:hypothetical protein